MTNPIRIPRQRGIPHGSLQVSTQEAEKAAPKTLKFVHLKVHSAYSLLEGALPIAKLAKLAAKLEMPALGLTDSGNLFGTLEFSDKLSGAGVQPIVGLCLNVDFGDNAQATAGFRAGCNEPRSAPAGPIALFAMNEAGYQNLMKLSSCAFFDPGETEPPHVKFAKLESLSEGLIALSGGPDGPIDTALAGGQIEQAASRLAQLEKAFGDRLYIELQRHGEAREREVEPKLLDLAYARDIPIVATNEVYFATPEDHEAHDALLCIAAGAFVAEDKRRRATPEHYFKSEDSMAMLFCDLPEALANTIEIAERCAFRPLGKKPILPQFVRSKPGADAADHQAQEALELKAKAEAGLEARLKIIPLAAGFSREDYDQRLAFELDVISKMKFPGYFLIVADFISWAKGQGIPVGPGRGSGAGSLVAYALTITDLDPLRFGLLFERFLNPERVSMPDFDIDFCQDRRDEVITYVQGKYGVDRVAQIITHGKLQARAVLRDVGRVLQMPYGQVDKLCKLVPNNPANPVTLPEAIDAEPKLLEAADEDPVVARLLEIAQKLEGLYRHASTHAAGIVIGDRPLNELVPLYRDPKSSFPVTQFNWKLVEAAGLVKFDFLGLKTLTVLQKAVEMVERTRGVKLDLPSLALEDVATYELLAKADTAGVFQLESTGMRESLKRLKPDRFEDIVAMVSLYRPGPMDNIPTYIARKHGEEPVDCLHPLLVPILKDTYGVIIYQEQVIQIAQVMGGYSLGQADLLRRAMGKKDKAEMAAQQARFVEGALEKGVSRDAAVYIFELVDKFAGYGFNKSHAAAYALISYHTAYLKAHYREEFLAASMTLDMGNTDKLAMFAGEARRAGLEVAPPCVNQSGFDFLPRPGKTGAPGQIRYALPALKNMGEAAARAILAGREKAGGAFKDLASFAGGINPKAINKRGLETLAAAGAFDGLEPNRALVHGNVDVLMGHSQRVDANSQSGIEDMFAASGSGEGATAGPQLGLKPVKSWTEMDRLEFELGAIGFFLSGHPLDAYQGVLAGLGVKSYGDLVSQVEASGSASARLAAVVVSVRERRSQKGNKFAFAQFSDATGQFEAVIFSDALEAGRDLLAAGTVVLLSVEAEREAEAVKMRVVGLAALEKVASEAERGMRLRLDARKVLGPSNAMDEIKGLLKAGAKGEVRFVLALPDTGREIEMTLPGRFETGPMLRGRLAACEGVLSVEAL